MTSSIIILFLISAFLLKINLSSPLLTHIDGFMQEEVSNPSKMRVILLSGSMSGFFTTDQINEIFSHLVKKYPANIKSTEIGKTKQKNAIMSYKLSTNLNSENQKAKVLFTGLHHAREVLVATMIVKIFLETLHSLLHSTNKLTYFNYCDVLIVPIVNVDGHKFISESFGTENWDHNKMKRKNMNRDFCSFVKKRRHSS